MTQSDLERTLIAAELRCGRCGYNLRGLSPLGKCPECGHDIWATVVRTIDPAASRLPKLTNPKAVAWATLWIMLSAAMSAFLLAFGSVRDALNVSHSGILGIATEHLAMAACVTALSGEIGVLILAPPRGKERSSTLWVRIWLLAIGFIAWAACNYWWSTLVAGSSTPGAQMIVRIVMAASWVIALLGIDGILKAIGQRSRAYRTARGGRQSAQGMIAACAALCLGALVQGLARMNVLPRSVEMYGNVVAWASALMLLIGLAYMLINTLWIFRALIAPPPPLNALLLRVDDHGAARRGE